MKNSILIVLVFFITSCSCNYKLKRLLKNCPELIKGDTLTIRDTIRINSVEKDTLFNYYTKDTVIIREGRLTMKYFYNSHDSTVYINGRCDTIFRIIETKVPTNQIIQENNKNYFWLFAALLLVIGVFIFWKRP